MKSGRAPRPLVLSLPGKILKELLTLLLGFSAGIPTMLTSHRLEPRETFPLDSMTSICWGKLAREAENATV